MPRKIEARPPDEAEGAAAELTEAQREMTVANLGLVYSTAKAMRHVRLTDDAIQAGMIGLMRATQLYDPSRGVRFSTYATYWIRQAISIHAADDVTIRVPRPTREGRCAPHLAEAAARVAHVETIARRGDLLRWNEPTIAPADPAESMDLATEMEQLDLAIDALPDGERAVMRRRAKGETLKAIGADMRRSHSRIGQIEAMATVKLKKATAAYAD